MRCPRKGPIPNEISLLICSQLHEAAPQRCAECKCKQAIVFGDQIDELRAISRSSRRVFREPTVVSDVDGALAAEDPIEGGEVV